MNRGLKAFIWFLRITLPCLVIFGSIHIFKYMQATAPQQERKTPQERNVFVEAKQVNRQNKVVRIQATGTVVPVERVTLKARVAGEALQLHPKFEPGEIIKQGDVIVEIDRADYLLLEKLAASKLIQAEYEYKIELGYQDVARHEWEMIEDNESASELEKELSLRKPHLKRVEAAVALAKTNLEQARLDLQRTSITLPFDALVISRSISKGSQITTQGELGVFVDASKFRVVATVAFDQLSWIQLPVNGNAGAQVEITPSGGADGSARWQGVVTGLDAEIESLGRMAQVLIEVEKPLEGEVPLLLNSFVSVAIASRELQDVFVIPSSAVHNGELVYVMNAESRVDFKKINVVWRDSEWIVVDSGLEPGDALITSDVPSAVPNMKVEQVGG
ncbi:MAG: efflux RND transporter periplasmic adaptor subunit [Kiritimatiellae bacterium]|nr:efflux RND transporter periplasmic adaptor subunit [Kiritimatiellia bacterium]